MGICISNEERAEKIHSFSIDRSIEKESKMMEREFKILLLGNIVILLPIVFTNEL